MNVEALLRPGSPHRNAPAARFTFSATNEWVNGTHAARRSRSSSDSVRSRSRRRPYTVDTDHPEIFAAEDNGPTPPEIVLIGLAGCLTAGVASVAQNRGIQLHSVRATVVGSTDLAGILGIDPDVRNGYSSIRVSYPDRRRCVREELQAVVAQSQKRSAVFDIVTNPTTVVVEVV
ncbi:MAG: OsmC family protein [Microthrixaceae bacterium]